MVFSGYIQLFRDKILKFGWNQKNKMNGDYVLVKIKIVFYDWSIVRKLVVIEWFVQAMKNRLKMKEVERLWKLGLLIEFWTIELWGGGYWSKLQKPKSSRNRSYLCVISGLNVDWNTYKGNERLFYISLFYGFE